MKKKILGIAEHLYDTSITLSLNTWPKESMYLRDKWRRGVDGDGLRLVAGRQPGSVECGDLQAVGSAVLQAQARKAQAL
jgi:hypothetical protein